MIEELMPESMRLIASHNRAFFAQDRAGRQALFGTSAKSGTRYVAPLPHLVRAAQERRWVRDHRMHEEPTFHT